MVISIDRPIFQQVLLFYYRTISFRFQSKAFEGFSNMGMKSILYYILLYIRSLVEFFNSDSIPLFSTHE